MSVLVTGVAGFIGSYLARALLDRGEQVIGIDNFSEYYDPVLKFARLKPLREERGFTFLEADIADRETILGVADKHPEVITGLKNIRRVDDSSLGFWAGVAPDGSLLLPRDIGTQEIYALKVKWP